MTEPEPVFPSVGGYEILSVLGRGGFATVYRAVQTSVGREVALKVLSGGSVDPNAERRFRHEVAAVAALSDHDHVISVHDVGVTPDGLPFIAMQMVTGGSFGDRVRATGALPPDEVARVGAQVADALQAAHQAGILHRDIKPDNILVGRRGQALLSDFGIATLSDGTRTATGLITGTLAFTAPELFQGGRPSPATDVFALGATLYALAAARLAFGADDEHVATMMYRITHEVHPPLPSGVPRPLAAVVDECLAKDPADRPVLVDLEARLQALAAPAVTTPPPPPPPPTPVPGDPPPRQAPRSSAETVARAAAPAPDAPAPALPTTPTAAPADAATRVQPATQAGGASEPAATRVQHPGEDTAPASGPVPPVGAPPASGPPVPPAPAPQGSRDTTPARSSRRGLLVAVGVVALLVAAAVAAVALRGSGGGGGGGGGAAVAVGEDPAAIAVDGTGTWVANRGDGTVTHLDPDGEVVATVEVGGTPVAVAAGPVGVWVADVDGGTVSRIDPDSGEVVASPSVGSQPTVLAQNASFLYVLNSGDLDLATVDPSTEEYGTDIGIEVAGTSYLAATDSAVFVATAADDGTNTATAFGTDLAAVQGGADLEAAPSGIAATAEGLWIALGDAGSVVRIDPTDGSTVATIEVGGTLGSMAVDGSDVWVADVAGERLVRLDVTSDDVAQEVAVDGEPEAFAVGEGVAWAVVGDEVRRVPI